MLIKGYVDIFLEGTVIKTQQENIFWWKFKSSLQKNSERPHKVCFKKLGSIVNPFCQQSEKIQDKIPTDTILLIILL